MARMGGVRRQARLRSRAFASGPPAILFPRSWLYAQGPRGCADDSAMPANRVFSILNPARTSRRHHEVQERHIHIL